MSVKLSSKEEEILGPLGAPTLLPPPSFLASINPLARLLALAALSTPLMVSVDWVSGVVALVLELLILAASGLSVRYLLKRTWFLFLIAPLTALTMLLYAHPGGYEYWSWGLMHITENSVELASATMVRVVALALPAVGLFLHTDPTQMADALAQNGRLPSRFVLASLSAVRMSGQLLSEWRVMELARRARGLSDSGRVRRLGQMSFALLVLALRRAADLSTAMEARGFGSEIPRSWARPSPWRGRDWMAILVGALVAAAALGAAVAAGTFRWFGL
ncbi:energy-coupling factor transporter transmembrane protein EcfT [Actinomycetaceae bacterium TAE3-ERU4]|nr:energy-coupling factor transporter transmembrane protein EcfT [Actinomycetaceae bacterium TAE3-ERU4]